MSNCQKDQNPVVFIFNQGYYLNDDRYNWIQVVDSKSSDH